MCFRVTKHTSLLRHGVQLITVCFKDTEKSIKTVSIMDLIVMVSITDSITALSINIECNYAELHASLLGSLLL